MKTNNYYFTYWMSIHSKKEFKDLTDDVCSKIKVPQELIKVFPKDDFLFNYFYAVYYTIALHYFGLNEKQIAFMLDIAIAPRIM